MGGLKFEETKIVHDKKYVNFKKFFDKLEGNIFTS